MGHTYRFIVNATISCSACSITDEVIDNIMSGIASAFGKDLYSAELKQIIMTKTNADVTIAIVLSCEQYEKPTALIKADLEHIGMRNVMIRNT